MDVGRPRQTPAPRRTTAFTAHLARQAQETILEAARLRSCGLTITGTCGCSAGSVLIPSEHRIQETPDRFPTAALRKALSSTTSGSTTSPPKNGRGCLAVAQPASHSRLAFMVPNRFRRLGSIQDHAGVPQGGLTAMETSGSSADGAMPRRSRRALDSSMTSGNTILLGQTWGCGRGGRARATSTRRVNIQRIFPSSTAFRLSTSNQAPAAAWLSGNRTPRTMFGCSAAKPSTPSEPTATWAKPGHTCRFPTKPSLRG